MHLIPPTRRITKRPITHNAHNGQKKRKQRKQEGAALAPRQPLEKVFTPFGGGARLCVGYRFAQQEVIIALARLFQRFTFDLAGGAGAPLRVVQRLTLCPADGVRCRVVRRAAPAAAAAAAPAAAAAQ